MYSSEKHIAAVFKALGDINRIRILKMLCSGEKCSCKLLETLEISQPTLSHHMKILSDAGIINGRRDGKWVHYSINCEAALHIREMMQEIMAITEKTENCRCTEK